MRYRILAAVSAFILPLPQPADAEVPRFPFSRHAEYAAGTIRPSQPTEALQDAAVARFYDVWKARFLVHEPDLQCRVAFGKKGKKQRRTVSEGQGYGMMITVLMAGYDPEAREIFDGFWRFSRAHPSQVDGRLMAWQVPSGKGDTADSAFDGDMDIAYGLLLADRQWGSTGSVNYREAALRVIAGIEEATIGPESHLPMLGDWVKGTEYTEWQTRTSDFMPGHFAAFGRAAGHPVWSQVGRATESVVEQLQAEFGNGTGLVPDFAVVDSSNPHRPKPAPARFLEEKTDGAYSFNACRAPWRIATDALLNGTETSRLAGRKLSHWIEKSTGGDPEKIRAGYFLDGRPLPGSDYFTSAYAAPFGVAAMLDPKQQVWLDKIYAAVCQQHEDYYEDSVNLLSLLVMTGHFWDPTLVK